MTYFRMNGRYAIDAMMKLRAPASKELGTSFSAIALEGAAVSVLLAVAPTRRQITPRIRNSRTTWLRNLMLCIPAVKMSLGNDRCKAVLVGCSFG
ncbi:hypothetical protein SAMN06265222_1075 [Neorhodopirellula lusitana]|uniref:Uncharacterized protein n=1 Tax=Neorhodopirellula lusitana TaxID=445327 RepID=A0ABY1Q7N7_9BACT|nr:hypothetical protein SAMN06265222_1075 [Neorhodopirellula lusitana]